MTYVYWHGLVILWFAAGGVICGVMARAIIGGTPPTGVLGFTKTVAAVALWPLTIAVAVGVILFTIVGGREAPVPPTIRITRKK